jgi:dTDP-4-amino-4,6-dideoxygalactose transaminase
VDERKAPRARNDIMEELQNRGISTRPGTHAVHMLGYYQRRFGLQADAFPAGRDCDGYTIALPLHNRMSPDDFAHVVASIRAL